MVGGGDNALTEILFLERFAKKIHLIHRRDQFRGCQIPPGTGLQLEKLAKVQIHWDTEVTEFQGQDDLEAAGDQERQDLGEHHAPGYRGLHRHRHGAQHRLAQ